MRVSGFLRALDGESKSQAEANGNGEAEPSHGESNGTDAAPEEGSRGGRRPGLLERITRVEKPSTRL
jgi:hypothetical protein